MVASMIMDNLRVYDRDGKEYGLTTGAQRRCQLDGCTGQRITVRWPDKRITRPCLKSLRARTNYSYQIV